VSSRPDAAVRRELPPVVRLPFAQQERRFRPIVAHIHRKRRHALAAAQRSCSANLKVI